MKNILLITFLLLATLASKAQNCEDIALYHKYVAKAKDLVRQSKYVEALEYYSSAKDWCEDKAGEVDGLISHMVDKIDEEKKQAQANLKKATEMQAKMELAVFDKAVKQKIPKWRGYNNYEDYGEDEKEKKRILAQLDSLDLSQNALPAIPKELADCSNLIHLNLLNNNDIDWKSLERLKDLPKLQSIYVSVNDLSDIEEEYWGRITGIEILKNGLAAIPENILAQKQLSYLDLEDNQFSSLPAEIAELKNLTTLDLEDNQLSSLPAEIAELKNLTSLYLSSNQFSRLPNEIGELKNLTELYLFNNQLSSLPSEIGELKNLTELSLSSNQLSSLPSEIGELKNLTELYLFNNQLSSLPSEIGELKNLTRLYLGLNQLSSLPAQIGELKNLTTLDLSPNQLSSLPAQIGELKKLTELNLWSNPIKPEEQEKVKQLLPNCKINFSEFTYERLLWAYHQQGILKEKVAEFKELKKLDLSDYRLLRNEQKEIQKLLPNCEITFRELSADDYNDLVIEEYNKGNYKTAYELAQEDCKLHSTNAVSFFNLAYFALYNNDYQVAISAAQKTLEIDPKRVSVETNLALGYLLNNQWEEAEKIYTKWKGKIFPDTGDDCNTVFLQDITDLEKAGVKHEDFERVRKLLE